MTVKMTQKGRSVANRILVIQALIAIVSALGFLLIDSIILVCDVYG